jgi:putative YphP/YqiW family bacilliredoxin
MYPEEMVKPMREELSDAGFQDLYNAEAVENALKQKWDNTGCNQFCLWLRRS